MPRIKLIVNPASDRGRTAEIGEALQALLHERALAASEKGQKVDLDWELTERPHHATEIAEKAARDGFDIVAAIGGDGTVHEVINGLMRVDAKKRPKLSILPVGTGNDFAHNLGLPSDPGDAAHCLFMGETRPVDIGMVRDGKGREEYWNNTLGIGFSGAVNILTRRMTKMRGFIVYLIAVLRTIIFKPPELNIRIQIDDGPTEERWVSMISICNGPREGGGFPVAPNAVMDDGLITYMLMNRLNRLQMLFFVPVVMSAKHLNYTQHFSESTARRIKIESEQTMAIHADGEMYGPWEADVHQIEVQIFPAALHIMCGC